MSVARFLIEELRAARIEAGMSQEDLGRLINCSGSYISAVENGTRHPAAEARFRCSSRPGFEAQRRTRAAFKRLASVDAAPPWLRDWIMFEREAVSLQWYEPAFVPGLLQTEPYIRATLAWRRLTADEVDSIVTSRIIAEGADGVRVGHADSTLTAQIVDRPGDLVTLTAKWERIRGEALSRSQSLDLLKEAATSWT